MGMAWADQLVYGGYDDWRFSFNNGEVQANAGKGTSYFAWAVRDGDVPEPATILLLGPDLIGLLKARRKPKMLV